jgi:5-methyltetrahydrofolate--homocysteine methyltransferase
MIAEITDAVFEGNLYDIEELVQEQLARGAAPLDVLDAMMAGLQECGVKFEAGEYFLPELIKSGDAFKTGMAVLAPRLAQTPQKVQGTVVLGTVRGDVHDIGKNLVGFMLESAGFRVVDLGVDVSPEQFETAVRAHSPDVLGLSALLTTTMLGMGEVIERLERAGLREKVKVIIGGAPVSRRFAEEIGADAYASDASQGVREVKALLTL